MIDRETTKRRGYDQLPIPFGWFAVARSGEIETGGIKPLRYFDRDLVVWRGVDGEVRALEAFCKHMGAHLGYASQVVGNTIRCAYHHWSFNGDGGVANIPYAKTIPPKLKRSCQRSYPVEEADGVIYAWYHPGNAAPKWGVSRPADCPNGEWVLSETHEWIIPTHCQDITENSSDFAHFQAVHGTQGPATDSAFALSEWGRHNHVETQMQTPRGLMTGRIAVDAIGPGQSMTVFSDITYVLMAQQVTPIDQGNTHVRWQLYHASGESENKLRVAKARMRDLVKQMNQDLPIWHNKIYCPRPTLVDGDGPLTAYREQYARFFRFDELDTEPAKEVA